jgi:hypothetical protein
MELNRPSQNALLNFMPWAVHSLKCQESSNLIKIGIKGQKIYMRTHVNLHEDPRKFMVRLVTEVNMAAPLPGLQVFLSIVTLVTDVIVAVTLQSLPEFLSLWLHWFLTSLHCYQSYQCQPLLWLPWLLTSPWLPLPRSQVFLSLLWLPWLLTSPWLTVTKVTSVPVVALVTLVTDVTMTAVTKVTSVCRCCGYPLPRLQSLPAKDTPCM